jgi:hypothetical protein
MWLNRQIRTAFVVLFETEVAITSKPKVSDLTYLFPFWNMLDSFALSREILKGLKT